jgi:glycosyltransferase involved in cell wall biosynthesis
MPDETIVTVRDSDELTWDFFEGYKPEIPNFKLVTVCETGVVAAMNLGLDHSTGDIISFTDDDAVPHSDWLKRIEDHFERDRFVGGVGGKDNVYDKGCLKQGEESVVGKVQWFGRLVGNHAIGIGSAREVDVLKGVNMSFRRSAIGSRRFDQRMRGMGAQVHFEIQFCLSLKRNGWKIIYDPAILVDHYHAERFDEDKRFSFNRLAILNQIHNETLSLLEHFSYPQKIIYMTWAIFIGSRNQRGLVQVVRFLPKEHHYAISKFIATFQGRLKGIETYARDLNENNH